MAKHIPDMYPLSGNEVGGYVQSSHTLCGSTEPWNAGAHRCELQGAHTTHKCRCGQEWTIALVRAYELGCNQGAQDMKKEMEN